MEKLAIVNEIMNTLPSTVAAVKNRILPILEHPAFNAEYTLPIGSMFDKPVRLMLKALQTVDMQFIVADTVLRHIFALAQSKGHVSGDKAEDKFRLFVIIDETKILIGNRGDTSDNYHILNRLATEARKYGIGLILASQVIRHFGRDIRSNAASKLVLRPMDVDEAKANAKELELDYQQLMDINLPGAGFFRSTALDNPIDLRLYPAKNRPIRSFDDE